VGDEQKVIVVASVVVEEQDERANEVKISILLPLTEFRAGRWIINHHLTFRRSPTSESQRAASAGMMLSHLPVSPFLGVPFSGSSYLISDIIRRLSCK
jgi:hypothetical protein